MQYYIDVTSADIFMGSFLWMKCAAGDGIWKLPHMERREEISRAGNRLILLFERNIFQCQMSICVLSATLSLEFCPVLSFSCFKTHSGTQCPLRRLYRHIYAIKRTISAAVYGDGQNSET